MTLSESPVPDSAWAPPELAPRRNRALEDPEAVRERIRREAHDLGYAEGLAAGRARAEAIVGELSALLDAAAMPFRAGDATLLRELVALVERTTRAVVATELESGRYDIEALLGEALGVLGSVSIPVEVSLNPEDAALCREHGLQGEGSLSFLEDPSLLRGGLRLRAGHRLVDATVERHLEEVLTSLRDEAGVPDPASAATGEDEIA